MSAEEPAWKAELEMDIARSLKASGIHEIRARVMARDAVLPAAWAAVKAAEERGRREALNQAADDFTADAWRSDEVRRTEILGSVAYLLRLKAES